MFLCIIYHIKALNTSHFRLIYGSVVIKVLYSQPPLYIIDKKDIAFLSINYAFI